MVGKWRAAHSPTMSPVMAIAMSAPHMPLHFSCSVVTMVNWSSSPTRSSTTHFKSFYTLTTSRKLDVGWLLSTCRLASSFTLAKANGSEYCISCLVLPQPKKMRVCSSVKLCCYLKRVLWRWTCCSTTSRWCSWLSHRCSSLGANSHFKAEYTLCFPRKVEGNLKDCQFRGFRGKVYK